jgi:single-strand DNA-binding protein
MYQKLIIIGNLGRDPEMRYTSDGTPVTSFSVAVNRRWTDQSGQRQDQTTWFRVSAWRRLAETCNQYLTKGRLVLVEGDLRPARPWQGQDGEWRASLEVTARNVQFLGGRTDSGSGFADGEPTSQGAEESSDFVGEEEIPF